jgi:uracil-DNA glycosylase
VDRLAGAAIGDTFNFYRDGDRAGLLHARLVGYLRAHEDARLLLVAEAPGYRGTRISGIPLTSERQLTGSGPSEATASIVQAALRELGLVDSALLWNVVPTHPGDETGNRPPTRGEIAAGLPFALELARGRRVVPVGRVAQRALGGTYLRHPSHGGAAEFRDGLRALLGVNPGGCSPGTIPVRRRARPATLSMTKVSDHIQL